MSTNEEPAAAGRWPDVAALRRLADELFSPPTDLLNVVPSYSSGLPHADPSPVTALGSLPPIPRDSADAPFTGASAITVGLPGEAELRDLLAALPIASAIPAGPPLASFATSPTFYFLDRAGAGAAPSAPSIPGFDDVPAAVAGATPPFDVNLIRRDFPILQERVNGRPLIWLDNAATTQKPQAVIDRLVYFYRHENSNVHRAAHELAARATDAYEAAREKVRAFLGAASTNEIVFVRGGTEAINLVAQSWGRQHIGKDDEIVISWLEHHANIVPWQQLAAEKGATLRVAPVDDDGQIVLAEYARLLGPKTKLVSVAHVSNALGTITPVRQIVEMGHSAGAKVLVDGAQAVSHLRVNVSELGADWYVFSGHKLFAPTGIGALYGKEALLNEAQPWQGGGSMIKDVTFERTVYQTTPARFEAGTGSIADAVGLGAAIDYVTRIGIDLIAQYEHQLLAYATSLLTEVPGLRLIGTAREKASVLSFVLKGHTTEDVGTALNREGIAVRAGHHCAQPILRRYGVESTVRPSLAFYNTCAEIDALIVALRRLTSGRRVL
jgi:cysteine desulfurase / selenocysteine lyase